MLADIIVIVVTLIKTFRQWNRARNLKVSTPLTTCLLRDGGSPP